MTSIITIGASDFQDNSRVDLNTNFSALNAGKVEIAGDTMTGPLVFSGSTNAGVKVSNLTTTQRNALTPAAGMVIYNTTLACFEMYQNGAWVMLTTSPSMTTSVRDTLTPVNGMVIYNSTLLKVQVYQNGSWASFVTPQYGGDGSDGALAISSGTTTIDCAGAQTVTKNYTSIAITGTGKLAFSNPHTNGTTIILKSQGDVTLTAVAPCISTVGMGASNGTDGYGLSILKSNFGNGTAGAGAAGVAGVIASLAVNKIIASQLTGKYPFIGPGAGGGGGGSQTGGGGGGGSFFAAGAIGSAGANTGSSGQGDGAAGGGALVIECGGALNFTTASGITVAGAVGGIGTGGGNAGGGGGGGAGICIITYNTLTANTGTITITGGAGGAAIGSGGAGGKGGDGYSLVAKNTNFV